MKEIEMENFKSFKKRIKVPVLEGYTTVTGPNGSGKSNISDAILFVLGPRSSRVLRAGRLTDLIFNGGQKNKKAAKDRDPDEPTCAECGRPMSLTGQFFTYGYGEDQKGYCRECNDTLGLGA